MIREKGSQLAQTQTSKQPDEKVLGIFAITALPRQGFRIYIRVILIITGGSRVADLSVTAGTTLGFVSILASS